MAPGSPATQAQVLIPAPDLTQEMDFFTDLGFVLDQIFPADNPAVAVMSGHNLCIRLDKDLNAKSPILHILTDNPASISSDSHELKSPGGTTIRLVPMTYELKTPPTQHKFEVRHLSNNESWVIGRAGMMYRDLIPDRLGGSIIASHINIPNGGPVPDMVHYHTIGFQLIFCYKGWVRLVYEDQGPPFVLNAGDCVIQPPEIRHRVLEASDNLEVIEIGVPAEHMTTIDHDMELPTPEHRPNREFQGQKFCRHVEKEAQWIDWVLPGFEYRDSGIKEATKGAAGVQVIRASGMENGVANQKLSQNADIFFVFIMNGNLQLEAEGFSPENLKTRDAFVIPPHLKYNFSDWSADLEMLQVSLPGNTKIEVVS